MNTFYFFFSLFFLLFFYICVMFRRMCLFLAPSKKKKKDVSSIAFRKVSGKPGSNPSEALSQTLLESLYEPNMCNDPIKTRANVENERRLSAAYDRLQNVRDVCFEKRMSKLIARGIEALEAIPTGELKDEATLLNSEQPPLDLRRPTLTPPPPPNSGFEQAYGMDVPQLRALQSEYPVRTRVDESLRENTETYPFAPLESVQQLIEKTRDEIEKYHGAIRAAVPVTGPMGEGFEAGVALQTKALARQQLILDLFSDEHLRETYDADESFREAERERRGIIPLEFEEPVIPGPLRLDGTRQIPNGLPMERPEQEPKYEPSLV